MCGRLSRVVVGSTPTSETDSNTEKDSILSSFGWLRDLLSFFWNGFDGFIGDGIGEFVSTAGNSNNDIFGILGDVDWSQ